VVGLLVVGGCVGAVLGAGLCVGCTNGPRVSK